MGEKMKNVHLPIKIVSIVTALSLVGDSMLYITLPIFWKEAGLSSLWQVGFLLSINRFVRLPANPLIGWLYNRISLKSGLIFAIIIGSISTLGYGVVKGFLGWIILRSLWGIAWSFFRIGGLAVVVQYSNDHDRGKAMGLYNGLYRTGSLVGMLIGGILAPILGLHVVSIIFGIFSLMGLPLIYKYLQTKSLESRKKQHKINIRSSYQSKSYIAILVISSFFITMFIQGIFTSTLSSLIEHHYGKSIQLAGIIISVTALSGVLQSIRWVWEPFLGSRIGEWSDGPKGRKPLFIGSLLLAAVSYGFLSIQITITSWIFITLIFMVSATGITTLIDALAGDIAKSSNAVSFLTLYSVVQDIGAALGPFIGYFFIGFKSGFLYLYFGVASIFLFLALIWFFLQSKQKVSFKTETLEQ
ncbi:MFS transporter [Heyndrickxia shackletonii]|nr:MFS transporter [Heyndrickxia shackletonii]